MDGARITKFGFECDYRRNKKNWCSELQNILADITMTHIYQNKLRCNIDQAKINLSRLSETEWLNSIQNKPKLQTYILYIFLLKRNYLLNRISLTSCLENNVVFSHSFVWVFCHYALKQED